MKIISFIALGFMSFALTTGLYHVFETHPNEKSLRKHANFDNPQMRKLVFETEEVSDMQGMIIGITGLIGFILGAFALIKTKDILSIIATVGSLAALLIVLITKTHMFS